MDNDEIFRKGRRDVGRAHLQTRDGSILILELNKEGFYWVLREIDESRRFSELDKLQISEALVAPIHIAYVIHLVKGQKDRCYQQGSLFNFAEFATTMFKKIWEENERNKKLIKEGFADSIPNYRSGNPNVGAKDPGISPLKQRAMSQTFKD